MKLICAEYNKRGDVAYSVVGDNALLRQYLKSHSMWKQLLEYGIDRKEFNDVDVDAVFDLIVFSYQGVRMYGTLMAIDEQTPERIISLIKTILLTTGEG